MTYNLGDVVKLKNGQVVQIHKHYANGAFVALSSNGMIIVSEIENDLTILSKFNLIDLELCSGCGDTAGLNYEKIDGETLCKICYDEHMHNKKNAIADQETEAELMDWGKM